ncbi:piRNA biogenesis protein EXD1-like [Sitophilus oryzae]|uniref:PiRNA biogenesis protein EXD1-like n=1 Tax=Sitophilus oryzae TaxID=7048 RepID=A0A6J2XGU0_SITOR|nr:piRNA biogenesis protein EXD1-like [Sitophilus oryzae]
MAFEYNTVFKRGTRLILELKSQEIYEGTYVDGGKNRIVLNDVIQHNNNNKLGDLYEFYRNEIAEIRMLKLPATKIAEPPKKNDNKEKCKLIKICEEDYFRLKETCRSYIFIENADKRYFEAMKVLNDAETIGVVSLGMEKNRYGSFIRLLVLCTWKQVYIIDLINVEKRELYPEIKQLFESEYICKVIHKSSGIVDILYRHYNVYMQNIFDTQIVDLSIQKKQSGSCPPVERNLSECLMHYLNLPQSIIQHALEVPNKKWNERPINDKLKLYGSQLAVYLIVLKDYLQKLLLKDVFELTTKIQDCVYNSDDFEFSNYVSKNEVPKKIQKLVESSNTSNST